MVFWTNRVVFGTHSCIWDKESGIWDKYRCIWVAHKKTAQTTSQTQIEPRTLRNQPLTKKGTTRRPLGRCPNICTIVIPEDFLQIYS